MKYTAETTLTLEYPTHPFSLPTTHIARHKWRLVQATPMPHKEINIIHRGSPIHYYKSSRQNIIQVDWSVTYEEFMQKIREHFSKYYKVEPEDLRIIFEGSFPFMQPKGVKSS